MLTQPQPGIRNTYPMKHIQAISRPGVSKAQMSTGEILTLVATILSTLSAVMVALGPIISKD